jgi:hypothetical protein
MEFGGGSWSGVGTFLIERKLFFMSFWRCLGVSLSRRRMRVGVGTRVVVRTSRLSQLTVFLTLCLMTVPLYLFWSLLPLNSFGSVEFRLRCVLNLAWQLLLDRIPTRDNLRRRDVIWLLDANCPFCDLEVESARHLFLHCRFTARIWFAVLRWFGVVSVLPPSVVSSFAVLVGCGSNNKRRKGLAVIWLAFVWAVWKVRNDFVFNNVVVEVGEVLKLIQRFFWRWFLINKTWGSCLLYEWIWNPGECMLR